jgi:mono/diheme cytochrome c family protein
MTLPRVATVAGAAALLVLVGCRRELAPTKAREEAERIWSTRCANCHGDKGMGDGPGALIGNAKPRALADSGWQAKVTDEHIAKVIVQGGHAVGLDRAMAANPDLADKPEVVRALVQIVRDL